jgi:hypothetical protein
MRLSRATVATILFGVVGAAAIGALSSSLYTAAIGILTLAPLGAHARHVGWRNVLTEANVATAVVWFYIAVFPLRAAVVASSGYSDLIFLRGPVTSHALLQLLFLAAVATTVLVEAYYAGAPVRITRAAIHGPDAERWSAVFRLAMLLGGLSLVGLAGIVEQHGGISGARARFVAHTDLGALATASTSSVFESSWALFAIPACWVCAYVMLCRTAPRRAKLATGACALIIVAAELGIYTSRLNVILSLLGAWVVYASFGKRLSASIMLAALAVVVVASGPLVATRDSERYTSSLEHYSRIAGYGVLDASLALESEPAPVRAKLLSAKRWLDLPAYFVPSQLWAGRPNLGPRRLDVLVAQDIGDQADRTTGFPVTEILEGWLLAGFAGGVALSALFGYALGRAVRLFARHLPSSPGAVIALAFVASSGWGYYDGGDFVTTFVGQGRTAVYLALLLLLTGVSGRRRRRVVAPRAADASILRARESLA